MPLPLRRWRSSAHACGAARLTRRARDAAVLERVGGRGRGRQSADAVAELGQLRAPRWRPISLAVEQDAIAAGGRLDLGEHFRSPVRVALSGA